MPNRIPLPRGLEEEAIRKEPAWIDSGNVLVEEEPAAGFALSEDEEPRRKDPVEVDAGNVVVEEVTLAAAAEVPRLVAPPGEARKEPDYSEDATLPPGDPLLPPGLTLEEMYRIVRAVAAQHSGERLYAATLDDAAYAGVEGYGGRSFGLHFGLVLFTQESGRLGSVLRLMQQRDAALFDQLFGPDSLAVLQVTTAPTAAERLQLVSGVPLAAPGWRSRFEAAAESEACRNAQNEEAIARQMRPLIPTALALGLDTDRGIAMAYEAVVARGLGGGMRWLVAASGLLRSSAQVRGALSLLGFASLPEFEESTGWLRPSSPDPSGPAAETIAALLGEIRQRDAIPLPTSAEMQGRLLMAAQGAARARLEALQRSPVLVDAAYRLA